jgi:hypothetical protein
MLVTHHLDREVPAIVPIQRTPDACQKLQILGGAPAADDIFSPALYGLPYSDPISLLLIQTLI